MKIKVYWPQCGRVFYDYREDKIDAFWVECTVQEAKKNVFPLLTEKQIEESLRYWRPQAEDHPHLPFSYKKLYFLIAKDLKTIIPFDAHFPYAGQWNGYCPFRKIGEREISDLSEITDIVLTEEETANSD